MASFKTTVLVLFGALITGVVSGYHLHIASNYMMDVESNETAISFTVNATGVIGWVGIGINEDKGNMEGADLFIGGVRNTTTGMESYGKDYHGSGNTLPVEDDKQDWKLVEAKEENGNTLIRVSRLLDTSDAEHDKVIKNETMFLLWSYNTENDTVTRDDRHTERGSCTINLLTGKTTSCNTGGGGGGGGGGSGASVAGIALSTLLMGLVAVVLKD